MYVRSVPLVIRGLSVSFQTELAISTHVAVADTQAMVADIRRNVLAGQEGASGQNCSVGVI